MVKKFIDLVYRYYSTGQDKIVSQVQAQEKAIAKLQRPQNITQAILKTNFTNLNAEIASLGQTSRKTGSMLN